MCEQTRWPVALLVLAWTSAAILQSRPQPSRASRPVEIVQTIGCVEHRKETQGSWWLNRATEVVVAKGGGPVSLSDVEKGRTTPLGTLRFRLIGEADFLDTDGLLRSGERSKFTSKRTANASAQLGDGRKVLVKGLLIDFGPEKRLNLLSVVRLAASCN